MRSIALIIQVIFHLQMFWSFTIDFILSVIGEIFDFLGKFPQSSDPQCTSRGASKSVTAGYMKVNNNCWCWLINFNTIFIGETWR